MVILLDLVMPRTDGWEFRRAQLADPRLASIPVLVFSSFDSGPRNVADLRAAGFVTKPFTIAQLLGAIARFRRLDFRVGDGSPPPSQRLRRALRGI